MMVFLENKNIFIFTKLLLIIEPFFEFVIYARHCARLWGNLMSKVCMITTIDDFWGKES